MTNKKKARKIFSTYDKQIRKDMDYWIKYRPSRWGDLLPEKFIRPFLNLIKNRQSKKFFLLSTLIFSLVFWGIIPTINFIWSNIFRVWLILLIIPLIYWAFAIAVVYTRVIAKVFYKFAKVLIDNLIYPKF
tara:strand:+ start:453 stop:845 length:393 start_codon:yes stop_codon:yes gene_type:complete